jgi:hypothetical protein
MRQWSLCDVLIFGNTSVTFPVMSPGKGKHKTHYDKRKIIQTKSKRDRTESYISTQGKWDVSLALWSSVLLWTDFSFKRQFVELWDRLAATSIETNINHTDDGVSVVLWYEAASLGNLSPKVRNAGLVLCSIFEVFSQLKVKPLNCIEMSGTIYPVTRLPEERILYPHGCENLKILIYRWCLFIFQSFWTL